MIKKISLTSCLPFQQASIEDCKKINYIFGANGSGKTTISSFLAGDSSSRFNASSKQWYDETRETIYVYNRGFRRRNFQETIPGVFTLGSATIDDINELEQKKKDLEFKKNERNKISETYRILTQETIPEREKKFKDDAWGYILKANEGDFQKAFEGLRGSKEKFLAELKNRIQNASTLQGNVCSREDLISRAKTLYAGKPEKCNRFDLHIKTYVDTIDSVRTDSIWNEIIIGNKDIDIAGLINELSNSPWVDQGRQYIRAGSNLCPFCQKETITDDFRAKLESFFDVKYQQQIERLKELQDAFRDAADAIIATFENLVQEERSITVGKLDRDAYSTKTSLLKSLCSECIKSIEEKRKEPEKRISIPDVLSVVEEIQRIIETANNSIDVHNSLVDERYTEEERLTNDIWKTLIHEAHNLITTYQSDMKNLEKRETGIKNTRDSKQRDIDQLETLIAEKGKNITSVQPTIEEINRSLKAYGFTNFTIQPAEGKEHYYCIKRKDGTLATDTLSEGEETFLTFLYFMQWTKGADNPEHVSDKKIIVLDDPVSSLDSSILYIVAAMVKDLSKKVLQNEGDVNQLFLLTHNVFFHKEASFDPRHAMGNNVNFWIVRKDNDISTIDNYQQNNPISTSYELLWAELRDNKNISQIAIQNIMRRIIENYFSILGKEKDEALLSGFDSAEEKMIAKSLLNWINDGSHSIPDDFFIDSYTDAVPKYRSVFREIFRASGQIDHYNMMMRI